MNLIIGRKLYNGATSEPIPMEVDALKGWTDKGKQKGKGDGKGKTKDGKTRFEGTCNLCGKTGHKKEDCCKSEKGKGKGKQDHRKGRDERHRVLQVWQEGSLREGLLGEAKAGRGVE